MKLKRHFHEKHFIQNDGKLQTIMLSKSLLLQVPRQHPAFAQIKIIILMF